MQSFSELTLAPALASNLVRNGFVVPTPVQAESIPPSLSGRDVIATAQTGTGKTLAFALPVLQAILERKERSGIHAVILSPTRELALQINETFAKLTAGTGIRTAVVVGGMSESVQLRNIRGGARIITATPGRLADYLDRRLVDLSKVSMVILDEADRMLDMGFLPVIRRILEALPQTRQTMLFSATIERSVAHLIQQYVKDPVRISIGDATRTAENVDLNLFEVEQDRKLGLLAHMLEQHEGSFLVFSRTKHGADRLATNLARVGVRAARIHGDRTQSQRNQALKGFQQGQYRVLVATDVAARGIHVDAVGHVVNYDLPQAPEDFIHRVGRTGRAGSRGTAWTFSTRTQRADIRRIEKAVGVTLNRKVVHPEILREKDLQAKVVVFPSPRIREDAHTPLADHARFRRRQR